MELKEKDCIGCNQAKEAFFELNKFLHTENERYTTIVCGIGYASFITILINCHEAFIKFSKYSLLGIYIFLICSIFIFLSYELWKIKSTSKYTSSQALNIRKFLSNEVNITYQELFRINTELYLEHFKKIVAKTPLFFGFSFGFAMLAILLFLYLSVMYFIQF